MEVPVRSSEEQFDRQAEFYNGQWNRWSEKSLEWLVRNSEVTGTETVLDIATGTGFTALAFAPLVSAVVGLDVSSQMLEKARQEAESRGIGTVEWRQGSAERLEFRDESFDLVTCRVAPHHFLNVPQFVREVKRVLKPGGKFLLADTTVPDGEGEIGHWQNRVEALRDPSHIRNYSPLEWRALVEAAGMTVEVCGEVEETTPLELEPWLQNAGCEGEAADEVRGLFRSSPQEIRAAFEIEEDPDGEISFSWKRVVLKAVK